MECVSLDIVVVSRSHEYGPTLPEARRTPPPSSSARPTPTLSLAAARTRSVPVSVAPGAGDDTVTVGGVVSPSAGRALKSSKATCPTYDAGNATPAAPAPV